MEKRVKRRRMDDPEELEEAFENFDARDEKRFVLVEEKMERFRFRMNAEEVDQAFQIWNSHLEQRHFQMEEIRDRRREIIRRRQQLAFDAFDKEVHVSQEVLDDEDRELCAEQGRLRRQLFDLKSEERAQNQVHDELTKISYGLRLPRTHQAAYFGDVQEMKELIDGGADLNEEAYVYEPGDRYRRPYLPHAGRPSMTPLNVALWRGKLDVAELLMSSESRKNDDTKSIEWAIQNGEPGILEILTKTEDFDCGILHKYLVPGYYSKRPGPTDPRRLQFLKLLLRGGADVRMTKTSVNMLEGGRIESLFDPPLTYLYRNRPFNVEESESRVAMLKLLLAYGADPNQLPDYSLVFPLFIGEDPDYPPPVLHAASSWGEEQAVKELLSAGASPRLEDKGKLTALDYCVDTNNNKDEEEEDEDDEDEDDEDDEDEDDEDDEDEYDEDKICCGIVLVRAEDNPLRLVELSRNRVVKMLYDGWKRTGRANLRQYDEIIADFNIPVEVESILRFEV